MAEHINLDAEQALLGALFVNPKAYWIIESIVEPEDFYEPIHGSIFTEAAERIRTTGHVSPISLKDKFDGLTVGHLTVAQYLGQLAANAVTVIGAKDYALVVKELSDRRRLQSIGGLIIESVNEGMPVDEILSVASEELSLTNITKDRQTQFCIGSQIASHLESEENVAVVPTGLTDLDKFIGGFGRGDFVIIAGRPSMGKTTVASSIMIRQAKAGIGVAYFSLEMRARQIEARCLSDLTYTSHNPIKYQKILQRSWSAHELEKIKNAHTKLKSLPIIIDQARTATIAQIASRTRQIARRLEKQGVTLGCVYIDTCGHVRASDRYRGQKHHETAEIAAGLAEIARDMDVPVVGLNQLSRTLENRDNKRPILSDLRESGAWEEFADLVMFLYREQYYLEATKASGTKETQRLERLEKVRDLMEVIIAKQRNGPRRIVNVNAFMEANAIRTRL